MGIALLFISVLLFAYCMIFIESSPAKHMWVTGSVLLLAVVSVTLILNDTNHFGMKQISKTQEQKLTSSVKSAGPEKLLYKKLGNGQEKIYYYRTKNDKSKKMKKTDPMTTKVRVKRSSANKLKVVKNYWVYKNGWTKVFFAGGQPNHQFIDQHDTFLIDSDWQLVETKK